METNEVVVQSNNDPLNHSTSSAQEQVMSILTYHSSPTLMCAKGPSCIVIGCKNGQTNTPVKYYQVPLLSNTNNIARQWYINTLREDLLESQLRNPLQNQIVHYVCIEHFDEESFLIDNNMLDEQEQIMVLKEDAVPSLFEIEVFQKMIHYQEQLASNAASSAANTLTIGNASSNSVNSTPNTALPTTNQPKSFIQNAFSQHPAMIQPPSSFQSESNISNMIFNGEQINPSKMTNKRTRIDPEVRAALIQRVPKAVKRTAAPIVPTPTSTVQQKAQKAVKHTMPQIISSNQAAQMQAAKANSDSTAKQPKAVKRTNSFLKEMLPPPIMQSTKRPSVNKAVKHTGGAPHSYYQNQVNPILNSTNGNSNTLSNITSSSLNTNTAGVNLSNVPLNNQTNKLTITTTYVYKRIAQPPEIDLSLECEEEELIYVKEPVSAPVSKAPKADDENKCEPVETTKSLPPPAQESSTTITVQTESKSDEEEKQKEKTKENENEKDKTTSSKSNTDEKKTEQVEEKPKSSRNEETEPSEKITTRQSVKESEFNKSINKKQQQSSSTKPQSLNITTINSGNSLTNVGKQVSNKSSEYTNMLFKYYSRSQGELTTAGSSHQSRRAKIVNIPADMRPGNYPVKCNVCSLILENNIELTSHICSHLESDSNTASVYISPFDAVTTTCALCNSTFRQPFELIKHLDLKHMKELNEYKCRICERQHGKLSELIAHLNRTHSHQEMPYKCDACGFRTSFYADAIYHIKKEHTSTLRHFCPYCLKSIVLSYNKKLGHVQSNMFYAHLITHFNKQENDVLMPSKCKHCDKCILHVRYMRDHLTYDHNCNANEDVEESDNKDDESQEKVEVLSKSRRRVASRANSEQSKVSQVAQHKQEQQKVGRKRRVTNDLEEKFIQVESSEADSNQLEEDDSSENRTSIVRKRRRTNRHSISKEIKSEDEDVEVYSQSTSDTDETKLTRKSKSKRTSRKSVIASCANDNTSLTKPATFMRKQKALKQTNIKKLGRRRSTARTASLEDKSELIYNDIDTSMFAVQNDEILSALLIGCLRFHCAKREFKCVECNETELHNHFNNEYTCHQCFYNTNCSKSFEFHLHGHLDKKRVALWNKKLQPQTQLYKCACGFQVQSCPTDSYLNADVGNRVASHLLKCEHKYVKYEEKQFEEEKMETEENSNRNSEFNENFMQ